MLIPKDCVKAPVASNYCMFAIDVEATHWDLAGEVHGHLQGNGLLPDVVMSRRGVGTGA